MSEITLTVRDATRAISTRIHASRVDYLVAALSADPETIDELQAALKRYLHSHSARPFFDTWSAGMDEEPWDAGLCVIDLAGRLVLIDSTYSQPGRTGSVVIDVAPGKEEGVRYHLADDWLFIHERECWKPRADERRKQRLALPPLDARAVLYGKVCEFIVQACTDARAQVVERDDDATYSAISGIHARWLTTARDDLRGKAPRDVLLERHDHIGWEMQDRCEQWSCLGAAPPPLSRESAAYKFGGFGTHEIVMYYDMVRFLVRLAWDQLVAERQPGVAESIPDEVRELERARDCWLEEPGFEDLHDRSPASIIEKERIRMPEAMTGHEAMVEHDCPLCQMMADSKNPFFWHLDGCNMDQDFAFSFHKTREEWEAEQREWEEMSRKFEAERAKRGDNPASPWRTSYSDSATIDWPPALAVLSFASHLSELTLDLKEAGAPQESIDELNRCFGNFRDVLEPLNTDLLEPVLERMCEALTATGDAHPDLAAKATDLELKLRAYADRLVSGSSDSELPF